MTDTPPDEPQAPRAVCPLRTCDWSIPYPPSGDINELEPDLIEHSSSHTPQEFLESIGMLQNLLWERDSRISDLESALRGANFLLQRAGIAPKSPFEQATEQAAPPQGLLLPDHVVREMTAGTTQQHTTGVAKHGDVVPGKGKLVGKKITDPMVLRDLKKGKDEHGR